MSLLGNRNPGTNVSDSSVPTWVNNAFADLSPKRRLAQVPSKLSLFHPATPPPHHSMNAATSSSSPIHFNDATFKCGKGVDPGLRPRNALSRNGLVVKRASKESVHSVSDNLLPVMFRNSPAIPSLASTNWQRPRCVSKERVRRYGAIADRHERRCEVMSLEEGSDDKLDLEG